MECGQNHTRKQLVHKLASMATGDHTGPPVLDRPSERVSVAVTMWNYMITNVDHSPANSHRGQTNLITHQLQDTQCYTTKSKQIMISKQCKPQRMNTHSLSLSLSLSLSHSLTTYRSIYNYILYNIFITI